MKFRVATYNIRNGDADDGPNSWPFRRDAAVETIRSLNASIVGLQEVMKYQLDFIMDALPDYSAVGVGRIDGKDEGEFAPILVRRPDFEPVEWGWFMLSETPEIPGSTSWDTACERICTWARLPDFSAFNTHLDHVSGEARLRGVELILSRCKGPAIVMGDFNAVPTEPPIRLMLDAGFQDGGMVGADTTFHDWGRVDGGRIDYLFARGLQLSDCETPTGQVDGRLGSDHYPVGAWAEL